MIVAATLLGNTQVFAAEASKSSQLKPAQPEWRYSVRPGDNLIHFGRKHLINPDDWRILQALNKVKNPYRMPIGQTLRVPLHLVKQLPAPAEVVLSSGKAGILKTDKTIIPVIAGQQLTAGTELVTSEKSTLGIKLADGSVVTMQPNSILKLDTLSIYSGGAMVDTTLRLQQGKVEAQANPKHVQGNKMQIVTPSAVAAVRGTNFRVSASDVSIIQETLEGKVALIAGGAEVQVDKGFGSLSEGGAPPLPAIKLLAAPAADKLASRLITVPATFDMSVQDGAVAWLGKVSTEASFNTIAAESLSQGTQLSFNDLPDGQYFLQLRAKDKYGLEGYDVVHRFDLNARPFAPKVITPAQAEIIREPNPELSWEKIHDAKAYLIELARDADFKQMLDRQQVLNASYKLEKDLEPGQYYWRLASIDGADLGPYSIVNNFSYKPKPNAPDISQLKVKVSNNKVFVNTINAPASLIYEVALHNEMNQQRNVWQTKTASGEFSFLLKEYGKQTLSLRFLDADGTFGPNAIYEFDALPP